MKIVIDDKIPFIRGAFEPYAEVVYLAGAKTRPEDVKDADALITRTRTACNEALLKGSSVKMIATATIGFDHIDTAWVEANGIEWTNAPGCNSWSVKQYVSAVLCTLAREKGLKFEDLTLGVVGVGNVGTKVAEAARILGCRVLLNDPPRVRTNDFPTIPGVGNDAFTDLDTLVRESDIITLHVPLTKEGEDATWHLFDAARLSGLRKDQILINSSRGPVVDNAALRKVLEKGSVRAAVLDVWEGEPDLDPELVRLLAITTPHIAGYSADGKANGTTMSVQAVARKLGISALYDWKASGVPDPAQPLAFTVEAAGKSLQQVLEEAVLYTYDPHRDSDPLRADLGAFERLRGDYPVRREPTAFTVTLRGGTPAQADALGRLGFTVK